MIITQIDQEIKAKVNWLEQHNGDILHKDWLVQAVLSEHKSIEGDDTDFALCCMSYTVTRRVEHYAREAKKVEFGIKEDPQLSLPGYERLQKRYWFTRGGEAVGVPIEMMTDAEFEQKIIEHREMAKGNYAHADELERYLEQRRIAI